MMNVIAMIVGYLARFVYDLSMGMNINCMVSALFITAVNPAKEPPSLTICFYPAGAESATHSKNTK